MRLALMSASLSADAVDTLEMHGTGTPLGDPIEMGAATAVLSSSGKVLTLCAVKSALGHTEPAAGAASIWHMIGRYIKKSGSHILSIQSS